MKVFGVAAAAGLAAVAVTLQGREGLEDVEDLKRVRNSSMKCLLRTIRLLEVVSRWKFIETLVGV